MNIDLIVRNALIQEGQRLVPKLSEEEINCCIERFHFHRKTNSQTEAFGLAFGEIENLLQRQSEEIPVMNYRILTSGDSEELEGKINLALAEGWTLHGGVSVSISNWVALNGREGCEETYSEQFFAQAMVRQ